jgi:hypothetical protein
VPLPSMTLAQFLRRSQMTHQQIADAIGVQWPTVALYLSGERIFVLACTAPARDPDRLSATHWRARRKLHGVQEGVPTKAYFEALSLCCACRGEDFAVVA